MKTLLVLRHAKSSWENTELSDFERILNSRGLKTAPTVGRELKKTKIRVDLILSSPAKRAKQTAILVKETSGILSEIKYEDKIYEASSLRLIQTLSKLEDDFETVLLVGHNPGIEDLVRILTDKPTAFPTATLAKITLSIENWSEIIDTKGSLDFVLIPIK
jgi:phosphohistidine phosphatase